MKYNKFGLKAAVLLDIGINVFGATALVILLVSLLVRPTFWIGMACAIPGVFIYTALEGYILRENTRRELALWDKALKETEASGDQGDPCRFNRDGQCTYGEEPMDCVREENNDGQA